MSAKFKLQDARNNVIAFRTRNERAAAALRCEETKTVAICIHCGGWLAEGESEEDCSGARVSRTL